VTDLAGDTDDRLDGSYRVGLHALFALGVLELHALALRQAAMTLDLRLMDEEVLPPAVVDDKAVAPLAGPCDWARYSRTWPQGQSNQRVAQTGKRPMTSLA
jgi:hypothetical protein